MTPNESATTYYCTGESCTPGTVYSSAINVSSSVTLRFYSNDASNNSESIKTERYNISPSAGLSYTGQDTGGGGMDSKAGLTRSDFEGVDVEGGRQVLLHSHKDNRGPPSGSLQAATLTAPQSRPLTAGPSYPQRGT